MNKSNDATDYETIAHRVNFGLPLTAEQARRLLWNYNHPGLFYWGQPQPPRKRCPECHGEGCQACKMMGYKHE